jgi:osmoprotectant transport system ATP-binding protein
MIRLDRVTKRFADGPVVVDELSLDVPQGEVLALLGSSGSGKTTTLRMINRLVEPTSGTIEIGGRDVQGVPEHELRRGIGYVIQNAGLFPHRSVLDNITTVPRLLGWDRKRAAARARELMALVGLESSFASRYPGQLSGGQQQRVGVARALAADPPVLLMDEPFGAVDPIVREQLQHEFLRLQRELRKTVVFVTHDVDEAVRLGSRVAVMAAGGRLAQCAPPAELLARPATPFVADFLGAGRRVTLLSVLPASSVPVRAIDALPDWEVALDAAGRPLGFRPRYSTAHAPPEARDRLLDGVHTIVGPSGSAREVLEAALSSPAGAAIRIDDSGRAIGVSALADVAGAAS